MFHAAPSDTPVLQAAKWKHSSTVALLLDNGVDPDATDPQTGWTLLHFLASYDDNAVVSEVLG